MKRIIIFLSFTLLFAFTFIACERDEEKATIKENVTPGALSPLSPSSFILTLEDAGEVFQSFAWTKADYGFDASITYTVQFDVKGNNFASPVNVATVNKLLTSSVNIGDFNKMLLDKELEPDVATEIEFRVASNVNDHVEPVYSNIVEAVVTPYATAFPPIYMCGNATGGWDWTKGVEVRSIAPSLYQTIAVFTMDGSFRFFKQADWNPTSYNYPFFDGGIVSDSLVDALDGDHNFKVVSPTGYYQVTVNLKTKLVDFDAVAEPMMFMTGTAVGDWNWTTGYEQMTWKSHGVFEATTQFTNGGAFRFFAQKDWNPTSYNYPYFADGSVDELFENAEDGDKNFKFVGTTGMYKITVNMLDLTVTMEVVPGK